MEHLSLYRKWRPPTFREVIGQRHVTETLSNALSSGRLVHAYLFSGPRGTGKTSAARILAKAINCLEGPTATPCNQCEACISISEGTALDVIEIDAASNRKIDEIRDLLEKIPYTPTSLRTKVYIVDEVHQLTPEASSALLKTLEEPPGHVVFVLATTEPQKLLPTIISRCQRFDFSLVPTQDIAHLLEHISVREEIDIEPEAIGMIAENAHGSVRDAIGVMDQISSLSGEAIGQRQVAEILGEVEVELVFEMVDLIADRGTPGALSLIGRMVEGGKDPRRFVESVITHLRYLFLIQNAANPEEIVEATQEHFERMVEQAQMLKRFEVIRLMERLGETHREMRWSANPRLVLECALVKATRLDADITLEGLDYRMSELERKLGSLAEGDMGTTEVEVQLAPASTATRKKEPKREGVVAKKSGGRKKKKPTDLEAEGEGEPEVEVNGGSAEDEMVAVGTETGGVVSRDKARRAWSAVLAEFKKQGQMRLFALLAKAKIEDVGSGKFVLGFPADASFQLEVLQDSEDIKSIEENLEHLLGERLSVKLVAVEARKPKREAVAPPKPKRSAKKVEPPPEKDESATDAGTEEASGASAVSGSRDVANILKDRFDGEIIED